MDVEFLLREIGSIHIGNFELTSLRWLEILRNLNDLVIVDVDPRHSEIGFGVLWFLFN